MRGWSRAEEGARRDPEATGACSLQAKLPRGIHQVRPHLQNIDNVPLLVPLFTDCTPESESRGRGCSAGPGGSLGWVAHSRESEVTIFIRCSRNWGQDDPRERPISLCLLFCPVGLCPAPHMGLPPPDSCPPVSAPSAMCEMIKIMQEYGEVTCCLGSSANLRNSCLFLQSDIRSESPLPPGDPRRGLAGAWGRGDFHPGSCLAGHQGTSCGGEKREGYLLSPMGEGVLADGR